MSPVPGSSAPGTAFNGSGVTGGAPTMESLADIGTHLRSARVARGLSLREMARRIGVSPSFVSQVELGKAKPSLGTLYGFLSELDLSLDELMPSSNGAPAVRTGNGSTGSPIDHLDGVVIPDMWVPAQSAIQAWGQHPLVQMRGVTWRRLTPDDELVDFLHVTYEPGSESCPSDHLMRHEGHEYGHILSGRLRLQVAFEFFDLGPGDAINFPSTTPHRLSNEGTEPCTSVWVVVGRRSTSRSTLQHP